MEAIRSALKSQYHASLAMLRAAIRRCPDDLWTSSGRHANPFWRIAYHTLYYTHLYLQPNNWVFRPWEHHQRGIQRMRTPLKTKRLYAKAEVLAYWSICDSVVDGAVEALDLNDPQSGFSWYNRTARRPGCRGVRHPAPDRSISILSPAFGTIPTVAKAPVSPPGLVEQRLR